MADSPELLSLKVAQLNQIVEQYRVDIYQADLKRDLLLKVLEEKGILVKEEFNKRWPLYLENDVGVLGPNGVMSGNLKVTMFGE